MRTEWFRYGSVSLKKNSKGKKLNKSLSMLPAREDKKYGVVIAIIGRLVRWIVNLAVVTYLKEFFVKARDFFDGGD